MKLSELGSSGPPGAVLGSAGAVPSRAEPGGAVLIWGRPSEVPYVVPPGAVWVCHTWSTRCRVGLPHVGPPGGRNGRGRMRGSTSCHAT